ncbi:hypothetical protein F4819DRAFT_142699 [Hypoxylon fuscum]|nr:hypothetical protein F4819DRAFT_142699 [Hypoxylon fuscum]
MMRDGDSVRDGLCIDSSTAVLSIKLVRILHLTSSPILVVDLGSLRVFEFSEASYRILICTGPIALDKLLGTGSVWLYLREIDEMGSTLFENAGSTLFFLREAQQGQRSDKYDLVCCCVCWDLVLYPELEEAEELQPSDLSVEISSSDSSSDVGYTNGHTGDKPRIHSSSWACPLLYETPHAAISMFLECYGLDSRLEVDMR